MAGNSSPLMNYGAARLPLPLPRRGAEGPAGACGPRHRVPPLPRRAPEDAELRNTYSDTHFFLVFSLFFFSLVFFKRLFTNPR